MHHNDTVERQFGRGLRAALASALLACPALAGTPPDCGVRWSDEGQILTGRLGRLQVGDPGVAFAEAGCTLELPRADGSPTRLALEPVDLLSGAPHELRMFRGRDLDDATVTARLSWTPRGLHAVVFRDGRAESIEPAGTPGLHRVQGWREVPAVVELTARPIGDQGLALEPRRLRLERRERRAATNRVLPGGRPPDKSSGVETHRRQAVRPRCGRRPGRAGPR